jgi:hypothetical protein
MARCGMETHLVQQPRLADARLASQHDQSPISARDRVQGPDQRLLFGRSSGEDGP